MSGTIAVTMAGLGSRFAKAGYMRPKYEIDALGIPLFDWSMFSLEAFRLQGWHFRFAVRSGLDAPDYIRARGKALGIADTDVLILDRATDGQATTALMLAERAPQDKPFAIYNIDTFVSPSAMVPPNPTECAGWIPCFPAPGEGWSFARTDDRGEVVELREKQRISDHATVGLYWFDRADRYVRAYQDYYGAGAREEKGERYVAPLYNQLISEGARVRIASLSLADVGMLGTPEQVADFIAHPPKAALDCQERFAR